MKFDKSFHILNFSHNYIELTVQLLKSTKSFKKFPYILNIFNSKLVFALKSKLDCNIYFLIL